MKNLLFLLLFSFSLCSFGQETFYNNQPKAAPATDKTKCITIGILQGGGSLVGADFEALVSKKVGVQVGMGLIGFGAGLNYHFKPNIRSSFLSLQYMHQGYASSYTQSVAGATYVFRGKKWFTFQIGLGFPLETGPALPEVYEVPPIMLMYYIGGYIPF